ncbi:hypothetical protein [Microbacterium sp.]|uniref:hypothetical protein n=1 Tax=Microbacterium sp. TaxID=51671 RepID=UPI00333E935B
MLDGEDFTLLRELQRRAYGRGDALSEAEAETLRALQTRSRRAPAEETVRPPDAPDGAEERSVPPPLPPVAGLFPEQPVAASEEDPDGGETFAETASPEHPPASEGATEEPGDPRRPPGRRRALLLGAVTAVAALLVGLGIGWAAFGRDGGTPMTAAQHEVWKNLEASGDYDAGSVQFAGEKYEVAAWQGTKNNGEMRCIILTTGEGGNNSQDCQPAESVKNGYFGSLNAQINTPESDGDQNPVQIMAVLATDAAGKTVLLMQRIDSAAMEFDWRSNFSGDELAYAEKLVDAGYKGESLNVVGYVEDAPIWMGDHGNRNCLVMALDAQGAPLKAGRFDDPAATPFPDSAEPFSYAEACDVDTGGSLTVAGSTYSVEMTQRGWLLMISKGAQD